ncbi:MAG: hypothetical protein JW749_11235 [Sedimentisphaerales bacterium]|nr:hypothetical protein [Sedimentisphaerales bacterium]
MSNSRATILLSGMVCLWVCGLACGGQIWCPDLAQDNAVNFNDFVIFAGNWGNSGYSLQGDFDNNGSVDIYDLKLFADWWLADYGCKEADFNLDYFVNFLDFAKLAEKWLIDSNDVGWGSSYDLDDSNSININDLRLFTERWLETCPESNDVFDAFKNALAAGDIETALTFVADSVHDRYSQIFQVLGSNLPDCAEGMGNLTLISQDEGRAVYEMSHQDGSTTYSFPVVFIKDEGGNWKIYNF